MLIDYVVYIIYLMRADKSMRIFSLLVSNTNYFNFLYLRVYIPTSLPILSVIKRKKSSSNLVFLLIIFDKTICLYKIFNIRAITIIYVNQLSESSWSEYITIILSYLKHNETLVRNDSFSFVQFYFKWPHKCCTLWQRYLYEKVIKSWLSKRL